MPKQNNFELMFLLLTSNVTHYSSLKNHKDLIKEDQNIDIKLFIWPIPFNGRDLNK